MNKKTATIRVEAKRTYTGKVVPFYEGFIVQLRADGRICLLPSVRECEFSTFETALAVLMEEIATRLKFEKEAES